MIKNYRVIRTYDAKGQVNATVHRRGWFLGTYGAPGTTWAFSSAPSSLSCSTRPCGSGTSVCPLPSSQFSSRGSASTAELRELLRLRPPGRGLLELHSHQFRLSVGSSWRP